MNHNTFIPVDLMELQTSLKHLEPTPEETTTTFTASREAALPASGLTPGVEAGGQGDYASLNPGSMQHENVYSETTP